MDLRLVRAFERETTSFHKAAAIFSRPIKLLEIPLETWVAANLPW
jgi:hypothetical protein